MHDKSQLLEDREMDRPDDASEHILKNNSESRLMFGLKLPHKNNQPGIIVARGQVPQTATPKQVKHL
jgi:hypothetical protein